MSTIAGVTRPADPPIDPASVGAGSVDARAAEAAKHALEAMYERVGLDFAGMSGAQIMAFMSRVMRDVDAQLAAKADTLQERNARSAQLAEEIAVLERMKLLGEQNVDADLVINGEVGKDKIEGTDVETWLQANGMHHLIDELDRQPRKSDSKEGEMVTAGAIKEAIDRRKAQQNSLSSMSEMDMIQFQSIVQTRQLFVNLATQMMNSQHEGQSNVVRNIG